MRIAIIGSRGIPARYGGFEVFAERLSERLAKKGFQVDVYCKGELRREDFSMPNVRRLFVPCPKIRFLEKLCISNLAMLRAVFSKANAVILLGVSGVPLSSLARVFGKKVILNPDGIEWKRKKWNFLGRALLRSLEYLGMKLANVIVVDSMAIGKYIRETYGRGSLFIPYGTDSPNFREEAWKRVSAKFSLLPDDYYIAVGRDVPENNFFMIIDGFLNSGSRKKLVIVSDLGESYEKFGGNERVVFTGPIYSRDELFALRVNAFAHIHGHSVGGTNPSLLEAIASGNVVLAYDVDFNREVLGEYGLYFSNASQLSSLVFSIERPGEVNSMRKRISPYYNKILRERYNWDRVSYQYEMLLMKVRRQKRGRFN